MLKSNVFGYCRAQPVDGLIGKVFAVRLAPECWGFVRFRHGSGFGFLPTYGVRSGMPRLDWSDATEKWFATELSGTEKYESDDFVLVGQRVPISPWMPDRFQRPQFPWQRWTILRADEIVHVSGPDDVVGLEEAVWLNPEQIKAFLDQKYTAGELKQIEVDPAESMPADADLERREAELPTIVFAKIVQPIGPAEREVEYEEPLAHFLAEHGLGEITGGGTMQDNDGSILFAGIDIEVSDTERAVPLIAEKLAALGAPQGSQLEYADAAGRPRVWPIRRPR